MEKHNDEGEENVERWKSVKCPPLHPIENEQMQARTVDERQVELSTITIKEKVRVKT